MNEKYSALRATSFTVKLTGYLVMGVGGAGAFIFVAVNAPPDLKWTCIPAALVAMVIGGLIVAQGQLFDAFADTAEASLATAETLDEMAEKLDQLIAIQARASGDLGTLASTVRKRDQA